MALPTNNLPVEDNSQTTTTEQTPTGGALPGASVSFPKSGGKNALGVTPNIGQLDEASTADILANMQRFVEERQSPTNKLMRGLNMAYATTYGPSHAAQLQQQHEAEDVQTQNYMNTIAGMKASLARNKALSDMYNQPVGGGVAGGAPGQGGAPGMTRLEQDIASLPVNLQTQAKVAAATGNWDKLNSLIADYEIKGKPTDQKMMDYINSLPEGNQKQMLLRQHLEKAFAPITTYEGGFEKKVTPPWAGVPGAAAAPTTTTGGAGAPGGVTSPYGSRALPGATPSVHGGVDLAMGKGTPVNSFTQGTVKFAGDANDGYGNKVVVQNPDGTTSLYAHLDNINVKPGDTIDRNSKLGAAGQTGKATGPHLHFEVRDASGKPIDPNTYLTQKPGATATVQPTTTTGGVPAGTTAAAETSTKNLQSQNEAIQKEVISPLLAETKKDILSVPQIDRAIETLDDPNTKVGPGSTIQQTLLKTKGIFTQLPPSQLRELTNSRIMDQASKRRVTDGIKTALGGQLSDSDVKFVTDGMFTIDDPKQFIKATLEIEKANAAVRKDMLGALTHSGALDKQAAYNEYVQSGRGLKILQEKAPSLFKNIDNKKPGPVANAPSAAGSASVPTVDFNDLKKPKGSR